MPVPLASATLAAKGMLRLPLAVLLWSYINAREADAVFSSVVLLHGNADNGFAAFGLYHRSHTNSSTWTVRRGSHWHCHSAASGSLAATGQRTSLPFPTRVALHVLCVPRALANG